MIIWLASYPRSGNTFYRILLKNYFGINTYTIYKDPLIENLLGVGEHNPTLEEMMASPNIFIAKTHELPTDDNPAIYLVRDGRDALISHAHYILEMDIKKSETQKPSFRDILHDLIVSQDSFGGWGKNVSTWINRSAPTVTIKYETLISSKDPYNIVAASLEKISYNPQENVHHHAPPTFDELHRKLPNFFRKGKSGSWRQEMPPDLEELFWEYHGEVMKSAGYRRNKVRHTEKKMLMAYREGQNYLEKKLSHYRYHADERLTVVQELEYQKKELNKIIVSLQNEIQVKQSEIKTLSSELNESRGIIHAFHNSFFFWFSNGPFVKRIPFLGKISKYLQVIRGFFLSKLGVLNQHPPKPLVIPKTYHQTIVRNAEAPVISIVTPSFNQADFIGKTINSVLEQNYPKLEYVIQDGNSNDHTLSIVAKYKDQLTHFESRKDDGQAHAINLGFSHTHGEIMAYLNSDDILLPGSLDYVAKYFQEHPDVDIIYSHRVIINENDQEIGRWLMPPHDNNVLYWADYVPQETLFWRRRIWEKAGGRMDESFKFALDWDLLLRFQENGAVIHRVSRFLAAFRVHEAQKTSAHINLIGLEEMDRLRKQYLGRQVTNEEVLKQIRWYLRLSVIYHKLFRLGLIKA